MAIEELVAQLYALRNRCEPQVLGLMHEYMGAKSGLSLLIRKRFTSVSYCTMRFNAK